MIPSVIRLIGTSTSLDDGHINFNTSEYSFLKNYPACWLK